MTSPYAEYRADGWPLCPVCGEDELWSGFMWDGTDPKPPMQAWIDRSPRCYRCGWDSHLFTPVASVVAAAAAVAAATPPPPPPTPTIARRYGRSWCLACGMEVEPINYCGCGRTPATDVPAKDGADSDLTRRIRAAKGT